MGCCASRRGSSSDENFAKHAESLQGKCMENQKQRAIAEEEGMLANTGVRQCSVFLIIYAFGAPLAVVFYLWSVGYGDVMEGLQSTLNVVTRLDGAVIASGLVGAFAPAVGCLTGSVWFRGRERSRRMLLGRLAKEREELIRRVRDELPMKHAKALLEQFAPDQVEDFQASQQVLQTPSPLLRQASAPASAGGRTPLQQQQQQPQTAAHRPQQSDDAQALIGQAQQERDHLRAVAALLVARVVHCTPNHALMRVFDASMQAALATHGLDPASTAVNPATPAPQLQLTDSSLAGRLVDAIVGSPAPSAQPASTTPPPEAPEPAKEEPGEGPTPEPAGDPAAAAGGLQKRRSA